MARRLALVTGASAGIGAAFARILASHGYDVALTARRADRLEALAAEIRLRYGVEAYAIPADLADPAGVDTVLAGVEAQGRVIDALINNAGYGLPGAYAETSWADQGKFLQVMLTSVCELSHKVLPGMIERRFGRIVNVASLAGLVPGAAGHTLYAATKGFLVKFSQSLHLENLSTGVHVSALCPGFTCYRNSTTSTPSGTGAQVRPVAARMAVAGRRRGGRHRLRGRRGQPPGLRARRAQQDHRGDRQDPAR